MADHQVITNAGRELLISCLADGHRIEFLHYSIGAGVYEESEKAAAELMRRTDLKDTRQTFGFASSTRTDSQVLLTARATNEGLSQGYYMRECGVFARDADAESPVPVLYQVGVEDNPSYMPDESLAPTVVETQCYTVISNNSEVIVNLDQGAYALQRDLDSLDARVTALEEAGTGIGMDFDDGAGAVIITGSGGGGGGYVLPIASESTLGGVRIGSTVSITRNGTIDLNVEQSAGEMEDEMTAPANDLTESDIDDIFN